MNSRLNDAEVSLNTVVVWVCWTVGVLMILADMAGRAPHHPSFLGLAVVAFGIMRHIAGMLAHLDRRERQAFDLGRRCAEGDGHVHSIK